MGTTVVDESFKQIMGSLRGSQEILEGAADTKKPSQLRVFLAAIAEMHDQFDLLYAEMNKPAEHSLNELMPWGISTLNKFSNLVQGFGAVLQEHCLPYVSNDSDKSSCNSKVNFLLNNPLSNGCDNYIIELDKNNFDPDSCHQDFEMLYRDIEDIKDCLSDDMYFGSIADSNRLKVIKNLQEAMLMLAVDARLLQQKLGVVHNDLYQAASTQNYHSTIVRSNGA